MRRRLGAVAAAAIAISVFPAGVAASARVVAVSSVTFHDAVGEDPAGPDITSVVVSVDANRRLTFRVNVPNRPTLTEDLRMRIWIDADDDTTTGLTVEDKVGLDHFVLVDRWELGLGIARLYACAGSVCRSGPQLPFTYATGGTFNVGAADLEVRPLDRLRFSVESSSGWRFDPVKGYDFTDVHFDAAPDQGRYWTFDVPPLILKSFRTAPSTPRAGKQFVLRLRALRSASGSVARGKVGCSLFVGGRSFAPRTRAFVAGSAVCAFDVPRAAKGKRFRGSISLTVGGDRISRSVTGTIG